MQDIVTTLEREQPSFAAMAEDQVTLGNFLLKYFVHTLIPIEDVAGNET